MNNQPKYLFLLMLSYCVCILLANWFDPRLVSIGGLVTDAGTLVFPVGFLLSDLITEVYGYKKARQAIWLGFLFNIVFLLYGQLVIHLPSPNFANHNNEFDELLRADIRVIIGSFCSYLIAEPINSWIMAKLKLRMHGRMMAVRFLSSTLFASLLDSSIFSTLAFSGVMPNQDLVKLILTMWFIKVVVEAVGLPFSIKLAHTLKQAEKLDIYDLDTQFSLFSLDTQYEASANRYHFHETGMS